MRMVFFCHSLQSDWNHGNAHFLRGIVSELLSRGHDVQVYEPRDGWSFRNLVGEHGPRPIERFRAAYPELRSTAYDLRTLDLDRALDQADLVVVHEWNDPDLVRRVGQRRASHGGYRLLFHDTHHRAVTDRASLAAYDLADYDGVLAFGKVLRDLYVSEGWARRAWTWHEAADMRVFRPVRGTAAEGDLVWIGNWGDGERSAELREFLIEPAHALRLRTRVYGVRYPDHAKQSLAAAGIEYAGWLPNFDVPQVFARYRMTVHVPRRPYVEMLPGIPTIRLFEALACGIPLVCAFWRDTEGLFTPGEDFLVARDGAEMKEHLCALKRHPDLAGEIAARGLRTVLTRHTCAHRVDELSRICEELGIARQRAPLAAAQA